MGRQSSNPSPIEQVKFNKPVIQRVCTEYYTFCAASSQTLGRHVVDRLLAEDQNLTTKAAIRARKGISFIAWCNIVTEQASLSSEGAPTLKRARSNNLRPTLASPAAKVPRQGQLI